MNVLKKINQPQSDKPYHGLPKLALGFHKIECFRISDGKYGKSVIVELENEVIFLPSFISRNLVNQDIDDLNSCKETMFLYFGGKDKKTNK